jgi:hypothetical protein
VLGVVTRFGITVGKMDWLHNRSSWSLTSLDGKDLGYFDYVVATDKNIASQRFSGLTGKPPPLGLFYCRHNIHHCSTSLNIFQSYGSSFTRRTSYFLSSSFFLANPDKIYYQMGIIGMFSQ